MSGQDSRIVVDHTSLDDLVASDQYSTSVGLAQSFWASGSRPATSTTKEILEIALVEKTLVNSVQMELAKFPHEMSLQRWDDEVSDWVDMIETGGSPCGRYVTSCVPRALPSTAQIAGHQHPQHSFLGHWLQVSSELVPVFVQRMRVVLTRLNFDGVTPLNYLGKPVDYSLAVRNLFFGFVVVSPAVVPRTLPDTSGDGSYRESFASGDDTQANPIDFAVRTLDADRALTVDNGAWKSELLPSPDCVVSYFSDVRDNQSLLPRVLDRIWLDPINVGAHVTVYYTDQQPDTRANFLSSDKALTLYQVSAATSAPVQVTDTGVSLTNAQSLTVTNTVIGMNPDDDFWVGTVISPRFNPGGLSGGQGAVLDLGMCQVRFTDIGLRVSTPDGFSQEGALRYQSGVPITILVARNADGITVHASCMLDATLTLSLTTVTGSFSGLTVGSDSGRTSFSSIDLRELVVKRESEPPAIDVYAASPRSYSTVSTYAADEPDTSRLNALLRFDPSTTLHSDAFPWRIFSNPRNNYESMVWNPIPREYTMRRGWLHLPVIRASFIKLEITRLNPLYSDVYVPITQQIRNFPPDVIVEYRDRIASGTGTLSTDDALQDMLGIRPFTDTPTVVSSGGNGLGYSNTEVYVADDFNAAERLRQISSYNWSYTPGSSVLSAPRFSRTGVHVYATEMVVRKAKVAYQVGIRSIGFARSVSATKYNVPQIIDPVFDDSGIDSSSSTWTFDNDKYVLSTDQQPRATLTSQIYESRNDVKGLQFAAQQSPPRQIQTDPDFQNDLLSTWAPYGDARFGEMEESPALGNLVPVTRSVRSGKWGAIKTLFSTWGGIEAVGTKWADLKRGAQDAPSLPEGGISSLPIPQPAGGYLYAAARVIAKTDLTQPLWVQIVDSVTGEVLAEDQATVKRNQVAEWFTSFQVNSATARKSLSWGEVVGNLSHPNWVDTFTRVNSTSLGALTSNQTWGTGTLPNGTAGTSLEIVANDAKVTAAGQYSTVHVTYPFGSLDLNIAALVAPGTPVHIAHIGGLWLRSNGDLMDSETGRVLGNTPIASGNKVTIQLMPTRQLPSAQRPANADDYLTPWSVVVLVNDVFKFARSLNRPFTDTIGITGAVGQIYSNFAWTPYGIAKPLGSIVAQNPVPRDGSFDTDGRTWTETGGRQWLRTGTWTLIDGPVETLQAPAADMFDFVTDVGSTYGTLTSLITTGTAAASSYYVLHLDNAPGVNLYLRADGALVRVGDGFGATVLKTGLTPGLSGAAVAVVFARTADLPASFVSAQGLSTASPQTMVFLVNNVVTGTYQGTDVWTSSTRGVMGANGSTVSGFTWAADTASNNQKTGKRKWGDLYGQTWNEVSRSVTVTRNPVITRVTQKTNTRDTWYMNSAPLFFDPIVWEASNDGGATWTPCSSIRNNSRGVVMFDNSAPQTNRLRYRITAYAPNSWLSHLVLRPWYQGDVQGVPVAPTALIGPNVNMLDQYCDISEDPHFRVWSSPVPREWWLSFRSLLPAFASTTRARPVITERQLL